MSYDYKKKRQTSKICTEYYARNWCAPNQLIIRVITKCNKNFRLHCLQITKFISQMTLIIVILWKENKNLQKRGKFVIIRKLGFMKTDCSKKKDNLRKRKPLWRANCISEDKWCEFYKKKFSYSFKKIKLADLKIYLFLY